MLVMISFGYGGTLAIALHNNLSGACGSLEDAKEELKASNPVLIER